jgi:hypothetical protein
MGDLPSQDGKWIITSSRNVRVVSEVFPHEEPPRIGRINLGLALAFLRLISPAFGQAPAAGLAAAATPAGVAVYEVAFNLQVFEEFLCEIELADRAGIWHAPKEDHINDARFDLGRMLVKRRTL